MDWELDEAETCALFSATPCTIDETTLGRIVAFAEASRRLVVADKSLEDRARFRAVLIGLAKKSHQDWIQDPQARAPAWLRIEYPRNVAEIRRAIRSEDRKSRRRKP